MTEDIESFESVKGAPARPTSTAGLTPVDLIAMDKLGYSDDKVIYNGLFRRIMEDELSIACVA